MQISSRLLLRTAIVALGLMLIIGMVVLSSYTRQAEALSASDWAIVKGYVNSYMINQSGGGAEGEGGFVIDASALKSRIDTNGDGQTAVTTKYLGEGDDAAAAPVLVDNLPNQTSVIPGTNVRCYFSADPATSTTCMNSTKIDGVKAKVDAHKAAGFSTDVVVYCLTGHTEAPTTGAFGYVAQTGGLSTDGDIVKVYAFKWGRKGWINSSLTSYTNTKTTGTVPAVSVTYTVPTDSSAPDCSAETTDTGRVRCAAGWALYTSGGNVGAGISPGSGDTFASPDLGPVIDIRDPSPGNTIKTTSQTTRQIPYDEVFNTGLNYIGTQESYTKNVVASRTQHLGGIVAEGLRMLGYNASFLWGGMPMWNKNMSEQWVSTTAYSTITVTGGTYTGGMTDGTGLPAPTQSNISSGSITATSAAITRDASEAASMQVKYGTASGSYTNTSNSTVLNQTAKSVTLGSLSPGTTYYYKVTSYDGYANSSGDSIEYTFNTTCMPSQPALGLSAGTPTWASWSDYVNRYLSIPLIVTNTSGFAALNAKITGGSGNTGETLITSVPINLGTIAGTGGTAGTTVKFDVNMSGSFMASITGSAQDACNTFTYP